MESTRSLAEMHCREVARIRRVMAADPDAIRQLREVGLQPGVEVCMLQSDGQHVIVLACNDCIALDWQTAAAISVELL